MKPLNRHFKTKIIRRHIKQSAKPQINATTVRFPPQNQREPDPNYPREAITKSLKYYSGIIFFFQKVKSMDTDL